MATRSSSIFVLFSSAFLILHQQKSVVMAVVEENGRVIQVDRSFGSFSSSTSSRTTSTIGSEFFFYSINKSPRNGVPTVRSHRQPGKPPTVWRWPIPDAPRNAPNPPPTAGCDGSRRQPRTRPIAGKGTSARRIPR